MQTVSDRVEFESAGETLVGDLHMPKNRSGALPAVALIGPMTFERKQAPTRYAEMLAHFGYAALAFDTRYRGESGGVPRQWENPEHKVEDLMAAIDMLATREEVDGDRLYVVGICQGGSEALKAAQQHAAVKGLATLTSQYRDQKGDIAWLTQEGYGQRLEKGRAARQKYEETGEVDYVKAVDKTDMDVGMPGEFVWEWYQPWADRGEWENRYAVMSDADLLPYESMSSAQTITKPWLMVHGDNCFLPDAARRHFEAIPDGTPKRLVWDDTPHLSYYDQPEVIQRATREIVDWFGRD